jgi:hypothetical protein
LIFARPEKKNGRPDQGQRSAPHRRKARPCDPRASPDHPTWWLVTPGAHHGQGGEKNSPVRPLGAPTKSHSPIGPCISKWGCRAALVFFFSHLPTALHYHDPHHRPFSCSVERVAGHRPADFVAQQHLLVLHLAHVEYSGCFWG